MVWCGMTPWGTEDENPNKLWLGFSRGSVPSLCLCSKQGSCLHDDLLTQDPLGRACQQLITAGERGLFRRRPCEKLAPSLARWRTRSQTRRVTYLWTLCHIWPVEPRSPPKCNTDKGLSLPTRLPFLKDTRRGGK